jgi:hypothetical protein
MRPAIAPKGEGRHHGHDKLEFAYEMALQLEKAMGKYEDPFSLWSMSKELQILDGGDRDSVTVQAKVLSVGGVLFEDVDLTATFAAGVGNPLGSDAAQSNDSWWAIHGAISNAGDDLTIFLSTSRTAPTPPDGYDLNPTRYLGARRNNSGGDFYRVKNAPGSNRFAYNENIAAGDFLIHPAAPVAAANTWEDVAAAAVAPPGATRALLDAQIFSIAPAYMILRIKDKDLGNIPNTGDTLPIAGATRHGAPVEVGLNASQVFQIQANSTLRDVLITLKEYEDMRG